MPDHGFGPVYDENSRILILGSFPSVKSREQSFYYANPQNRFWRVISAITSRDVPVTKEEKRDLLLSCNIALWDVVARCDVTGSSDSSIKNVVPNDITLITDRANIETIIANGATAYGLYCRYCEKSVGMHAVKMPSTSPANAACSEQKLIEEWSFAICQVKKKEKNFF